MTLLSPLLSYTQNSVSKLRIDPARAYGGAVSEYFENVKYIPLETTKESLFGEINQMIVTDNSVVIYDIDTKAVLFFTLEGKYISKVNLRDANYVYLSKSQDGNIVISMSKNIREGSSLVESIFSTTGIKIKQASLSSFQDGLLKIDEGYFLGTSSCGFNKNDKPKDSLYHLINVYKEDSLYKSLLPYNQKHQAVFCKIGGIVDLNPRGLRVTDNSIYVSTPYEHLVYKVTKDTAVKMLQFVFPLKRSISDNILSSGNLQLIDSIERQINVNGSTIIQSVKNIVFYKDKILFKITPKSYIRTPGSVSTQQFNFIYDTPSSRLISMERLAPDMHNFFLPILGNGSMIVFDGLYFHKGAYYTPLSSLEMFTAHVATKSKNPQYPEVLKKYFNTQTRKSNPVIVCMKLKE